MRGFVRCRTELELTLSLRHRSRESFWPAA